MHRIHSALCGHLLPVSYTHLNFTVDTFGREITGISTEVRSIDGSRLIENSEVTGWKANGKSFSVSLTLKDLIDTNTQYLSLIHI